ncbi:nitronate monooxygenase [Nocardioides immobilis]|uniref:Nitronate monooxygenase n=1 Tax=Nocardioides immobilis TaxID=2049295 RepID=A0A417Y734_9ACTN|nr:nitronate monooxygenase [Nocardioides immobilis]RHW28510.1 nitronate monooxygenase [Nocardioides immobilis]
MVLAPALTERLALPLIAAPMTGVSGPELVVAACRSGVIGSFPTHNASTVDELDTWLGQMSDELSHGPAAPVAPNLVVHPTNERLASDLDRLVAHHVELVITSVGSPAAVMDRLHGAGCAVYADVATLRQAEKAIAVGVDGLVLLTAGAGGQTGQANPFAFVRAVRDIFDGTIVAAGGISDGRSVLAAEVLGADLSYMGTHFIATRESLASAAYREALVRSTMDDVRLSSEVGGLPASLLAEWLEQRSDEAVVAGDFQQDRLTASPAVWSAGHSVSAVRDIPDVRTLVDRLAKQYAAARDDLRLALA